MLYIVAVALDIAFYLCQSDVIRIKREKTDVLKFIRKNFRQPFLIVFGDGRYSDDIQINAVFMMQR
ncbi:hypothetical protein BH20ACI4_BH20ACI4_08280 [soil metagenome]